MKSMHPYAALFASFSGIALVTAGGFIEFGPVALMVAGALILVAGLFIDLKGE